MIKFFNQIVNSAKSALAFVQGDNEFSRASFFSSATDPSPSGFRQVLDPNLPASAGWPFNNIHVRAAQAGDNNQGWSFDFWQHIKTGALYENFYDEQIASFNGYKRLHSDRWFPVAAMAPTNGTLFIYLGGQWQALAPGTNGQILKMVSGVPTWASMV